MRRGSECVLRRSRARPDPGRPARRVAAPRPGPTPTFLVWTHAAAVRRPGRGGRPRRRRPRPRGRLAARRAGRPGAPAARHGGSRGRGRFAPGLGRAVSTTRCPTRSSPRARCSPSRARCCSAGRSDVPAARCRSPRTPSPPAPAPLALTWYGHSSVLLEVDGRRVLADPVWGERVSPSPAIGPRRLHPAPVPLSALPPVDAVVISHDHYDHLDLPTVRALLRTPDRAVRRPARPRQPPAPLGGPGRADRRAGLGRVRTRSAA